MKATPWLSVLMPIHEGEAHLPATLDSIVAEQPAGIELIALDSSPHRRCEAIVAHYADQLDIRYQHMPDCASWTAKTNVAAFQAPGRRILACCTRTICGCLAVSRT